MDVQNNETQLVCIARFVAKDGETEQLIRNLRNLIPLTLQEGGCIRYELNQCIDNPHVITFVEKWYDQKTFNDHCSKPYIVDFFLNGNPLHVDSFEVTLHKQILP